LKVILFILSILCTANFFSCNKIVQQEEQNAILNIMTSGVWSVQSYKEDSTVDITSSFSGYVFRFNQNGTVTGIIGSDSTSGTWSSNITNKTITANFPNATRPLSLLNSVWTITDSGINYVVSNTFINDSTANMKLQKQ